MRIRSILAAAVVVASAAAFAGCAADASSSDTAAVTAESTSLAQAIVGAYTRTDGAGVPSTLKLNADGSFSSTTVVECFAAPCPVRTDAGFFLARGTTTSGTLSLYGSTTTTTYKAALLNASNVLQLTTTDGSALVAHLDRDGQACGGIGGLACASGQTCVVTETHVDAMGICRARGEIGTPCGGIGGLPCDAGLACVVTASYPDAMGVCQPKG
jgi:hypothetical protein